MQRVRVSEVLPLLEPLLGALGALEPQLAVGEQALGKLCSQEPVIAQLTTAPGVGALIAASFVSVIDDAKRFRHAHQVESYIGLVPSENITGGRRRVGAISKKGTPYLRALLVQGAWALLCKAGGDDPLRLWGEAVAKRRGKGIAVVAVARRMKEFCGPCGATAVSTSLQRSVGGRHAEYAKTPKSFDSEPSNSREHRARPRADCFRRRKSSGTYFSFVDAETFAATNTTDVTVAPPYAWRP